MASSAEIDLDALRRQVDDHPNWYHRIELAPGVVTPGTHDSPDVLAVLDTMGLPRDVTGLRVLDVGCRDGFYAFEMERRGARVTGVDYADPEVTGFGIASRALGSAVEYVVANVYDLSPDRYGTFDLVLFLGTLYHLRNPLLALDRVRQMTTPGGLVFVETHILPGRRAGREPLWRFYPRDELVRGDYTNKWVPNLPGLLRVLEECQIEILQANARGQRAWVRGRAVVDPDLEYFRAIDASTGLVGRDRG